MLSHMQRTPLAADPSRIRKFLYIVRWSTALRERAVLHQCHEQSVTWQAESALVETDHKDFVHPPSTFIAARVLERYPLRS